MMQASAGRQPNKTAPLPAKDFLGNFVASAIQELKAARDPDQFARRVNGAQGQTIDDNKDYYVT